MPSDGTSAAPAALIRSIGGRIAFWSPAMEARYGYSADEARGRVSRELLRTTSWQSLDEIEAELIQRQAWHGGLIHYRADGQALVAANYWHLHHDTARGDLVTELHADLVPDSEAGGHLADVIATIAQAVSQPLTAVGAYISGVQRGLQNASPDRQQLEQAIRAASAQLAQAGEFLNGVRGLGENLRETSQQQSNDGARETVPLFQRLLQQNGLDPEMKRMIGQLLEGAETKLAALDQR